MHYGRRWMVNFLPGSAIELLSTLLHSLLFVQQNSCAVFTDCAVGLCKLSRLVNFGLKTNVLGLSFYHVFCELLTAKVPALQKQIDPEYWYIKFTPLMSLDIF